MKIEEVKRLVSAENLNSLKLAEDAILNAEEIPFEVQGDDEGEKLTHILSAIWVLEQIEEKKLSTSQAIRALTKKVRDAIT